MLRSLCSIIISTKWKKNQHYWFQECMACECMHTKENYSNHCISNEKTGEWWTLKESNYYHFNMKSNISFIRSKLNDGAFKVIQQDRKFPSFLRYRFGFTFALLIREKKKKRNHSFAIIDLTILIKFSIKIAFFLLLQFSVIIIIVKQLTGCPTTVWVKDSRHVYSFSEMMAVMSHEIYAECIICNAFMLCKHFAFGRLPYFVLIKVFFTNRKHCPKIEIRWTLSIAMYKLLSANEIVDLNELGVQDYWWNSKLHHFIHSKRGFSRDHCHREQWCVFFYSYLGQIARCIIIIMKIGRIKICKRSIVISSTRNSFKKAITIMHLISVELK